MAQQQYGITPPVSEDGPSKRELEATTALMDELKSRNQFESPEEARQREVVLFRLNTIVKDFVYQASLRNRVSETVARESGGKIFTFGSFRLGVHGPGADIDTLCVVPRHVYRDDFFDILEKMLRARPEVTELTSVPEAYVPIMKLKFSGIEIDLLFARLAMISVPDNLDLRSDDILRNIDEQCQRSLNGSRVTDEILRLVPSVPVFRDALRTIKVWAKQRAIYANVIGFLGGVAWAMLVARICQLYPNQCAGGIISRFFSIVQVWAWPNPILLKHIEEGNMTFRVWNPKLYPADRSHRMPIITPAYPSMCSTHNVCQSTQNVMLQEVKRGGEIVNKIMTGNATWSELFLKHEFFEKYRYYLQITASSGDADKQLKWSGTVESKLRQLVMKLEFVDTLQLAHPFVKGFDRISYCKNTEESKAVAIGEVPTGVAERTKEDIADIEGAQEVHTTSFYIGLQIEAKQVGSTGPRKLDISYPTNEFTKLVKTWDRFEEDKMGIIVRYIKAASLPDYVFEGAPRQEKEAKGVKRVKSRATNLVNDLSEQPSTKRIRAEPASFETAAPVPLNGIATAPPTAPPAVNQPIAAIANGTNGAPSTPATACADAFEKQLVASTPQHRPQDTETATA